MWAAIVSPVVSMILYIDVFFLHEQKSKSKKIAEETFYGLVQFYTIILFECNEGEDYGPAKTLMNTCFEFYTEGEGEKWCEYGDSG